MMTTLEATRPRRRTSAPPAPIREVCLTGDPSRRYRHARAEDSGLGPEGVPSSSPLPEGKGAGARPRNQTGS